MKTWVAEGVPAVEQARRVVDLIWISVLLDAGVPSDWKYIDSKGKPHTRSEGLAIASLEMYLSGVFSVGNANKFEINCEFGSLVHSSRHMVISRPLELIQNCR